MDGLGVGDVGNIVLRDRRQLSTDGIVIVVVTVNKKNRQGRGRTGFSFSRVCLRARIGRADGGGAFKGQGGAGCMFGAKHYGLGGALKSAVRDSLNRYIWEKKQKKAHDSAHNYGNLG